MRTRRDRRPLLPHGQRGSAVVQLAIAWTAVLGLILLLFQFTAWSRAHGVAEHAAQRALEAARVVGASDAAGTAEAQAVLGELAPSILVHPSVTVTRSPSGVRVEITGVAESVLPLVSLPVDVVVAGPSEHLTPVGP